MQDFSRSPQSVSGSVVHERLTEKHVGRFFWTQHRGNMLKVQLVNLFAEDGWFELPGGVQYVKCSQVKDLAYPDGPFLTAFIPSQVGQTFWVYQAAKRGQFKLLGIVAERGIFRVPQGGLVSLRWTRVTLAGDGEGQNSDDDSIVSEGEADPEWQKEAEALEKATSSFNENQSDYRPMILAATNIALTKLQKAIEGLTNAPTDPDWLLLDSLKKLSFFMQQRRDALQQGEGSFLCLPNEDGPIPEEIASAVGQFIQLYKPFFAPTMTSQKQADILIHESVHSCLGVTDYAYKWQHIFRFLPIEIRLKNPDSYVAVARRFYGEDIETPHSTDDLYDYTAGMIQHICYRGSQLLKRAQKGEPEILQVLQQLHPNFTEDQFKALYTLGTSIHLDTIVRSIKVGTFRLEYVRPIPAKLAEASAKVSADGNIAVTYIKPAEYRPYLVILMKVLEAFNYGKWNISIAKDLNEVTVRCLMPAIDGPVMM